MTTEEQAIVEGTSIHGLMTAAFQLTHRMHAARGTEREAEFRAMRNIIVIEIERRCVS